MELLKYKKVFLIYIIYAGILSIFLLIVGITGSNPMAPFIPGENMAVELVVIYLIIFTLGPIIGILFGFIFGPIFFFIMKKILGRKMIYGIQDRPEEKQFKKILRAFFPGLMALNFAMLLAQISYIEKIVAPEDPVGTTIHPIVVIAMLMFTVTISFALFSGIWFLLDSGIMYTNKEKDSESDQPIEVRSVGGFFLNLLSGYAGISVALGFYELAAYQLPQQKGFADFIGLIILLFPLPFFIMIGAIPAIILHDIIKKQRIKYMRKWATFFGAIDYLESVWTTKDTE